MVVLLPSPDRAIVLPTSTPFSFVPSAASGANVVVMAGSDGRYSSLNGVTQANGALAFEVGPRGQRADFHVDNQLYINGAQLTTSPASEFGLPAHKQVTEIRWSPNGRYVAFILSGTLPNEFEYGVWVFDTATSTANQLMRNDHRKAAHF
ncbi:MAG: hypothetical protein GY778_20180, partial [bacterium]|nr:hypothetical protein [bacterium]